MVKKYFKSLFFLCVGFIYMMCQIPSTLMWLVRELIDDGKNLMGK